MEITKVLLSNYLPYAKGSIIGRAIPSIDGLKPSQRRILYTMYKMGLINGNKTKSSNIVGQTMKLHPHGDMAIYETMVRMATGNESLNVPYVESKGNFGKVYSKDLAFAAPRYTEAKLATICKEIFDNIDEDAVDFIDNFDNTTKEPTLLPVKFPSILVNPSSGIAVGTSSNIPSFNLKNVCDATIGILQGKIKTEEDLIGVLGAPEFTTGGYIHADDNDLLALAKTGRHSFTMSSSVTTYPNKIVIDEIPYKTTAEDITKAIESYMKTDLREISDVVDAIGLKGFKLEIDIKRGYDVQEVLKKLFRLTPLRMQISFNTRVIVNDRCEELGLLDLLNKWVEFRLATITRIYDYKYQKLYNQEHLLAAWEKIKNNMKDVANYIANNNEEDTKKELISVYKLDEVQADYLLDMKIKLFTNDNLAKKLKELANARVNSLEVKKIIDSDEEKHKIIIDDLNRIIKNYGNEKRTHQVAPVVEDNTEKEVVIDDSLVRVVVTKNGYIKRLTSIKDIQNFSIPSGDEELMSFPIRNNEHLLIFTYAGECHKILVDDIDASRGNLKDKLVNILDINSEKDILFIDKSDDYSGHLNIVYPNGRGTMVHYSKISGKRNKYISLFDAQEPGNLWLTKADKFFMITAARKAAYCDLTFMSNFVNRVSFKVARVGSKDRIFGLQPLQNVPNQHLIDLDKYKKDYTVCIGEDELWETKKAE